MHNTTTHKSKRCPKRASRKRHATSIPHYDPYGRSRRKTRAEQEHLTTWVYQYFDAGGRLLYVGITDKRGGRGAAHEKKAFWFQDVAMVTYARYEQRTQAQIEEARIIRACRPLHNLNAGISTKHWANERRASIAPSPGTPHGFEAPRYLLHSERVIETLRDAERALSMQEIRRRTPGNTQAVRVAIDEVVASGKAIAEKGTNGYRIVLADRAHLLEEETVTKHAEGTLRERILAVVSAVGAPIPLNEIKRRTRGKTRRIEETVKNLLLEGRLVETSGPRRARLIAVKP